MSDSRAEDFVRVACQYYVTARFAMQAQCFPVCGNLFHHAVEMLLKGGLARKRKVSDLKDMGHDLKKLWKAFKTDFPDDVLKRHDETISTLDKFEAIRYPDISHSIGMSGQWCGPAAKVTGHSFKTPEQYAVVVSDIDDLIADVFKASSWDPAKFAGTNPAALEAITRHNKHFEFLIKGQAALRPANND